jgi:hypothetical protein
VGRSLKTTNVLESVNAQAEQRCGRVDHWKSSAQKHRWLAAVLLDIEPRLRRLLGYRHLRSCAPRSRKNSGSPSPRVTFIPPPETRKSPQFQLALGLTHAWDILVENDIMPSVLF